MQTTISTDDIQFLEANRNHYNTWVRAQYIQHLDGATRTRMLMLIRKYFAPGYLADLWCQSCVAAMVLYLYRQYDAGNKKTTNAKPVVIQSDIDLIGDFIGTIPSITALADEKPVQLVIKTAMQGLAGLIPPHSNLQITTSTPAAVDVHINLQQTFTYAAAHGLHMIQAHYHSLGLPVPATIPRPVLKIVKEDVPVYDYILAPFSRSLPPHEKWQQHKWRQLVNSMPGKTFCLFGSSKHDDKSFITGANVTPVFDESFNTISNIMQRSRHGVLSVVTGISHLAHALQVKNYLFFNQGAWGKNPDAILFPCHIQDVLVDEVKAMILSP